MGKAFLAIPIGLLLFAASFVLLFWNEGRAVHTARGLAEGKAGVVSISADRVDPLDEGRLVHVSGEATTGETLKDPEFAVSARAIRLRRVVQMYQWKQESHTQNRKKLGGGEERVTTYTYEKAWSSDPVDSSHFKVQSGHRNPGDWPFATRVGKADRVTLGAFRLSASLADQVPNTEPLPLGPAEFDALPDGLRSSMKPDGTRLYRGADPARPEVGDMTVAFEVVRPQPASVLARQAGDGLEAFATRAGTTIERLQGGTASAAEMFRQAEAENTALTWVLRLVGFLVMGVGLAVALGPLSVLADVVPFLGGIVGAGTTFVAFSLASVLSLATIAVGWMAYRPAVGVAVLALAGLLLFGFLRLARGRQGRAPARA